MASLPERTFTVEEYLQRESTAKFKSDYYQGQIYSIKGGAPAHNTISENVFGHLFRQLLGRPCRAKNSEALVKAESLLTYPDVSVVCPPIEREPGPIETLKNPVVIFEVLSATTERYDRNVKLPHYQRLPSVREVVVVLQDAPVVEQFKRHEDGNWQIVRTTGLDQRITIPSINCELTLAQIYADVEFPPDPFSVVPSSVPRGPGDAPQDMN